MYGSYVPNYYWNYMASTTPQDMQIDVSATRHDDTSTGKLTEISGGFKGTYFAATTIGVTHVYNIKF